MVTAVLGGLLRALLHDPTDRPERGLCVESGRLISYTRYARGYPFPVITVVIAAARRMHIHGIHDAPRAPFNYGTIILHVRMSRGKPVSLFANNKHIIYAYYNIILDVCLV